MKQYFKNLMTALAGKDPFGKELDGLKKKHEETARKVAGLQEMYYQVVEKWDAAEKKVEEYQLLIENLRERVREKDGLMARMKEDYQRRIGEYTAKIDELTRE